MFGFPKKPHEIRPGSEAEVWQRIADELESTLLNIANGREVGPDFPSSQTIQEKLKKIPDSKDPIHIAKMKIEILTDLALEPLLSYLRMMLEKLREHLRNAKKGNFFVIPPTILSLLKFFENNTSGSHSSFMSPMERESVSELLAHFKIYRKVLTKELANQLLKLQYVKKLDEQAEIERRCVTLIMAGANKADAEKLKFELVRSFERKIFLKNLCWIAAERFEKNFLDIANRKLLPDFPTLQEVQKITSEYKYQPQLKLERGIEFSFEKMRALSRLVLPALLRHINQENERYAVYLKEQKKEENFKLSFPTVIMLDLLNVYFDLACKFQEKTNSENFGEEESVNEEAVPDEEKMLPDVTSILCDVETQENAKELTVELKKYRDLLNKKLFELLQIYQHLLEENSQTNAKDILEKQICDLRDMGADLDYVVESPKSRYSLLDHACLDSHDGLACALLNWGATPSNMTLLFAIRFGCAEAVLKIIENFEKNSSYFIRFENFLKDYFISAVRQDNEKIMGAVLKLLEYDLSPDHRSRVEAEIWKAALAEQDSPILIQKLRKYLKTLPPVVAPDERAGRRLV